MTARPQHVVVVGRDAALWLTAATIAQALGPAGVRVTAIELPTRSGPSMLYTALPALEALHAKLGINEHAMLRATGGSYTLGWNVVGGGGDPFFVAHGAYGAPIDGESFFGFWAKARHLGLDAAFEDFSPTAMAARHGRVLIPDDETAAFGRTDYGYHLPAIGYLTLLKRRAFDLGVNLRQAMAIEIVRVGDRIVTVQVPGAEPIHGDLFVDATGERALLPGVVEELWRERFPVDRELVARGPGFASVPAYSELRLVDDGWVALHAGPAATQIVHGFASADGSDSDALAAASRCAGIPLGDAIVRSVVPGRLASPWVGNCVAIGESAVRFDPVFGLDLHAIQLGIVRLLSLFPVHVEFAAEADEYNRVVTALFDRLSDFQSALYALARRPGRFWDRDRARHVPPPLAHRIATFRARGEIAPMEHDGFDADQWRALLTGLGETPESWPPAIDRLPPDRLKAEFRAMLAFVKQTVLAQPHHDALLAKLAA